MTTQKLQIQAPAKINLVLRVCGKRADGYHEIETVMQKLDLSDQLCLRKTSSTKIVLRCLGASLPEDEGNLVYKAALAFFDYTKVSGGVSIDLTKRIPIAAGLGGGSSDAAAALLGLNVLFGTEVSPANLEVLGGGLGADVPFFIKECGAALATGIGTHVQSIKALSDCWVLLVNPGIIVSTKWVYNKFRLTIGVKPYRLSGCSKSIDNDLFLEMAQILKVCDADSPFNDLESVTVQRHGVIQTIKEGLLEQGACFAMMSGSGPTVFGIFSQQAQAEVAYAAFRELYDGVFLTRTISFE